MKGFDINERAANDETMGLEQAAKLLHIGVRALKHLIEIGEVPALSCNQKHWVLLREDLITFIRDQSRKQAGTRRAKSQPQPAPSIVTVRPRSNVSAPKPDLSMYEVTTSGRKG